MSIYVSFVCAVFRRTLNKMEDHLLESVELDVSLWKGRDFRLHQVLKAKY